MPIVSKIPAAAFLVRIADRVRAYFPTVCGHFCDRLNPMPDQANMELANLLFRFWKLESTGGPPSLHRGIR
jgi:diadenosine tetraphosphatase ApaH/serine/threonine PP2A family protein phosphatase